MTDMPPPTPTPPLRPASPMRRTAARAARAGVSVIWVVPLIALLVTLALAWNAYSGRGTLVSVVFSDATGITPGETTLKFREITVGQVEAVRFTPDLQQVIVDMRVDPEIAEFIDDEAEFWIVRPQVSTQGISRLDTVLTGAFIEGYWDAEPGPTTGELHRGLDQQPLTRSNEPGTWVTLTAEDASGMTEGAPISYRGLTVGRMQNLRLSENDELVVADVFIQAPHDRQLTTATVFWDTAGFSVTLGTQGVQLNVNSVSSLLQGGAEFATLTSGGQPVQPGHVFRLQPDEEAARQSLFAASPDDELRLTMLMEEAVPGLTEGADVQFQGLTVGRVTNLAVRPVQGTGEVAGRALQDITLAISPQRLGLPQDATREDALAFLQGRVANGLRARITGAGFFGTSLMVELVDLTDVPGAQIVTDAKPYPIIPSAPPDLSDISTTAQGFMNRIGKLKLEELLKSATDMMNSVTAIASSQDTRAIPETLRRTIDEAQATMTELRTATQELRASDAVENIAGATRQADEIATKLNSAADRIPGILDSVDAAAASVAAVDFAALATEAQAALADIRAIAGSDAARALPERLTAAVDRFTAAADQIGGIAAEVREGGAAGQLRRLVDEAAGAAEAVRLAAADVPEMVGSVGQAADQVATADLAALSAEAQGALADIRRLVGSEPAQALPERLTSAVDRLGSAADEIGGLAAEVREGGAPGELRRLVDEASAAAEAVRIAAADVPAMVEEVDAAAQAVEEFDFAGISAEATGLIADLRAMLSSEDAAQLPRNLSDTLQAASGLLNDLRDGNAAGSLNAALASARRAMDQVAQAANTLPQLSQRFQSLAARAEAVIAAYGERGTFNNETVNTMRSLRRAADAFGSLATTIERNPRAFLLGR